MINGLSYTCTVELVGTTGNCTGTIVFGDRVHPTLMYFSVTSALCGAGARIDMYTDAKHLLQLCSLVGVQVAGTSKVSGMPLTAFKFLEPVELENSLLLQVFAEAINQSMHEALRDRQQDYHQGSCLLSVHSYSRLLPRILIGGDPLGRRFSFCAEVLSLMQERREYEH